MVAVAVNAAAAMPIPTATRTASWTRHEDVLEGVWPVATPALSRWSWNTSRVTRSTTTSTVPAPPG